MEATPEMIAQQMATPQGYLALAGERAANPSVMPARTCNAETINPKSDAARASVFSGTLTSKTGQVETYSTTNVVEYNGLKVPQAILNHYYAGPSDPFYASAEATLRGHLNLASVAAGRGNAYEYRPSPSNNADIPSTGNVQNPETGMWSRPAASPAVVASPEIVMHPTYNLNEVLSMVKGPTVDVNGEIRASVGGRTVRSAKGDYYATTGLAGELNERYGLLLTPSQGAAVNAGYDASRSAADVFFRNPVQSVQSAPIQQGQQLDASKISSVPIVGAPLLGLAMWGMGAGEVTRDWFSGAEKALVGAAAGSSFEKSITPQIKFATGAAEFIPEAGLSMLMLPAAGLAILTQPAAMASNVVPGLGKQAESIQKEAAEDPFRLLGNLFAMVVTPKIIKGGSEIASQASSKYMPIGSVDIGSAKITSLTWGDRVLGGVSRSAEGMEFFRGAPTEILKRQTIEIGDLFNVREPKRTPSPKYLSLVDPFLRDMAKGTINEPIVNALFDIRKQIPSGRLGQSESILKQSYPDYTNIGSFQQTGVSQAVQVRINEVLGDVRGVRLGSSASTDFLGRDYMRNTLASDIDVDIPRARFQNAIDRIKIEYAKNPELVEFTGGGQFKLAASAEGEHIFGASFIEKHRDVRWYSGKSVTGTRYSLQTPEYGIESKASRMVERIRYSPDRGVEVSLGGKKPASDIADIYAGSRGISRVGYERGFPEIGEAFERISDNLRRYGNTSGLGDVLNTIPKDILKGVQRDRSGTGIAWIDRFTRYLNERAEYPSVSEYARKRYEAPRVINAGIFGNEYPSSAKVQSSRLSFAQSMVYPEAAAMRGDTGLYPSAVVSYSRGSSVPADYPVRAASSDYQISHAAPVYDRYPAALDNTYQWDGVVNIQEYPGANKYPGGRTGTNYRPSLDRYTEGLFGGRSKNTETKVITIKSKDETPYLRKRRIPKIYQFQEISPVITPNELIGNVKPMKPFYRVTGKGGLVEKRTPLSGEVFRRAEPDFTADAVASVSDATGMNFYRTATKKEGAPKILQRKATPFDVVEMVGGFKGKKKQKSSGSRLDRFTRGLF